VPDTPSVVIVKSFTYRGLPEEFSNKYHFSGGSPANLSQWEVLARDLATLEKTTVPSSVKFVRAYGYQAGIEHSVAQVDLVNPGPIIWGTFTPTDADAVCSGDVAATIRWNTGQLNSRGKKIYCRKYMHAVYHAAGDPDAVMAAQKTALQTFAGKLIDGTSWSGLYKYCGPQGAVLSTPLVDNFLTTRTLKRRGKRPLP
jgi:hypothetical protein